MAEWLRNNLKKKISKVIFNVPEKLEHEISSRNIKKLWEEHQNGSKDNSNILWAIYSLFVWFKKI